MACIGNNFRGCTRLWCCTWVASAIVVPLRGRGDRKLQNLGSSRFCAHSERGPSALPRQLWLEMRLSSIHGR
eukprot:scaffold195074_cov32-Tisochrysis_lutea.AAC.2